MRKRTLLLAAGLLLGCGDDDSTAPDASDAPGEESAESGTDDGTTNDEATTSDDALVPDDTVVPDDAAPEILDTPADDATEDDDAEGDVAGTCGPSWHPTACGDCGGHWTGDTCNQGCDPTSCGDGREYLAECDGTTHTCRCSIDGVEVCTCTSANPVDVMGCQPEEWGGANCCWNVG